MPDYSIQPSWDMVNQKETWDWECGEKSCDAAGSEATAEAAETAAMNHVREAHPIH